MLPTPMKPMQPAQGQPMPNRPAAVQQKIKKPLLPKLGANQAIAAGAGPQAPQSVLGGARLLPQRGPAPGPAQGSVRANAARQQMQMNVQKQQAMLRAREQEAQMQGGMEQEGPPPDMQEMGGMMDQPPPMAMEDPGMMPPPESLVPPQMQQMGRPGMPGMPPGLNRLPAPPGMPGGNWNPMNAMGKMGNALGRFRGFNPFGGR